MLKKIAQIGPGAAPGDIFSGYSGIFGDLEEKFARELAGYLSSKYVFLMNSGLTGFYVILETIKGLSPKKEVILPAYTAPSMILPVLKASLKPVLCDITGSDFNMDMDLLSKVITKDTLCVVPTHLFGLPVKGVEEMKERFPGIFIIEDCAQSLGSKIKGRNLGCFGDAGFTSFNRGKNLSTYGGGCIYTNSPELGEKIRIRINNLKDQHIIYKLVLPFKLIAFSLAVTPYVYGAFYPVISKFKDNGIPEDFFSGRYTGFQAGVGLSLFHRINDFSEKRHRNGMFLINGLSGIKEAKVPRVYEGIKYAFNRMPVLVKDPGIRMKIKNVLWKTGIDTSYMYLKPFHHIFDLGYQKEEFPNANHLAYNLITLPVHASVDQKNIERMINEIKKAVK